MFWNIAVVRNSSKNWKENVYGESFSIKPIDFLLNFPKYPEQEKQLPATVL